MGRMTYSSPPAIAEIAYHAERDYAAKPAVRIVGRLGFHTVAELRFPDGAVRWVTADEYGANYRDNYPLSGFVADGIALSMIATHLEEREEAGT